MNRKLVVLGIALALVLVVGTYAVTSSLVTAQMSQGPQVNPDTSQRIAAALERIATAMEKPAANTGMMNGMGNMGMMGQMGSGMMGGIMNPNMMGQMDSGMMGNMMDMGQMHQMHQMMQEMQGMMKQMQEGMGQMMPGMENQAPMTPKAPTTTGVLNEADLTRASDEAGVKVDVAFMNPLLKPEEAAGRLVFKVTLNTHTIDLSKLDLTKLASLRTSTGFTIAEGFTWEPVGQESGHHRTGLLKIGATSEGKPLITKETKYIELELKDIVVPSRLFKWEGDYLVPKAL
ncbi:hypothetical protein HY230_11970 [Candidatus Acetothermia bacterium]|nr:hypothetical protein [Candidatus Acetothermia bacterium]